MDVRHQIQALGLALLVSAAGCSLPQSMTRVLPTQDAAIDDPLEKKTLLPRPSYLSAKKELSNADQTTLEFARWKESIGDYQSARESYGDIVADNPANVDARIGYARVEYRIGQKSEAEKILKATIAKYPSEAAGYLELGRVYGDQQRWQEAVETLNQAVKLDPADRTTNYELGLALANSEQTEAAIAPLTVAVGSSAALYNIGYLLQQKGRMAESREWMNRALSSNPDEKTRTNALKLLAAMSTGDINDQRSLATKRSTVNLDQSTFQEFTEQPGRMIQRASAEQPADATNSLPIITAGPVRSAGKTASKSQVVNATMTRSLPPATISQPQQTFPSATAVQTPPNQWQPAAPSTNNNAAPMTTAPSEPPRWRGRS